MFLLMDQMRGLREWEMSGNSKAFCLNNWVDDGMVTKLGKTVGGSGFRGAGGGVHS